jgi:hypothetical protein
VWNKRYRKTLLAVRATKVVYPVVRMSKVEILGLLLTSFPAINSTQNQVSWQSAFWPIIACILNVMLQNVGRVCGGHFKDSVALRSSPFVCIADTILMLVEFIWMLVVGCPVRVAIRHVWYDRFEKEKDQYRSTIGLWRWEAAEAFTVETEAEDIRSEIPRQRAFSASATALDTESHPQSQENFHVHIPLQTLTNLESPREHQNQANPAVHNGPSTQPGLSTQIGPSTPDDDVEPHNQGNGSAETIVEDPPGAETTGHPGASRLIHRSHVAAQHRSLYARHFSPDD